MKTGESEKVSNFNWALWKKKNRTIILWVSKKGSVAGRWAISSTCFPELPPTINIFNSTNSSYPFFILSFHSSIANKEVHVLSSLKQHPLEKFKLLNAFLKFWPLLAFQLHSASWLQWPPSNGIGSFALSSLLAWASSVLYLAHSPAPCRHLPLSLLLLLTAFPDPRD